MMSSTTLSIDKAIHQRAAKRASIQKLSVSAVARLLLDAYAQGRINIMAVSMEAPIELRELSEEEITPGLRKAADKVYHMKRESFINI